MCSLSFRGPVLSWSAPPGHFLSAGSSLVFPLILTKGERVVCDLDGDSLPSDRQLASPQQSSTGELHE